LIKVLRPTRHKIGHFGDVGHPGRTIARRATNVAVFMNSSNVRRTADLPHMITLIHTHTHTHTHSNMNVLTAHGSQTSQWSLSAFLPVKQVSRSFN